MGLTWITGRKIRIRKRVKPKKLLAIQRGKIRELCSKIPDQETLNALLLTIPSRIVRREVFEVYKPYLKFQAVFEGEVATRHQYVRDYTPI